MPKALPIAVLAALVQSGCAAAYDPPVAGDRGAPKFQGDLLRCRQQADAVARRIDNATPSSAVMGLFRSHEPEHAELTKCMVGKGYAAR